MKWLKTYKVFESKDLVYSDKDFLDALTEELKQIGFDTKLYNNILILDIVKPGIGTFISFNLDGDPKLSKDIFSIDNLRKECLQRLENSKVDWKCSDMIKDDYDVLCTSILVFIDEWENK